MAAYEFTNNWFQAAAQPVWDQLIPMVAPRRILEIGSYEGASACYLIDKLSSTAALDIHCIDTWEGGIEHKPGGSSPSNMSDVEARFYRNVQVAINNAKQPATITVYKGTSDLALTTLFAQANRQPFDLVYVDGSHQAPDVLLDAILGFKLLKVGGFMFFDDYLWAEQLSYGVDPVRCPKFAIDAFTNIFCRKIRIIRAPLYQLYVEKITE
jgi:hypothetical protein